MISIKTIFVALADAKASITATLLDAHLSYTVYKSDVSRLILKCKYESCTFAVRAIYSPKEEHAIVSVYKPHICAPVIYAHFKGNKTVKYFKKHHCAAVLVDRSITPSQYSFRRDGSVHILT